MYAFDAHGGSKMHLYEAEGFLASGYFQTIRTPWPKHPYSVLMAGVFFLVFLPEPREPLGAKALVFDGRR